ncbi:RIP metalloprotease RseP [Candidatus Uhrbacteria bacterium]|nr:RIP metalloprotease RseP [Candidatus Uhrbacteria bacterium]
MTTILIFLIVLSLLVFVHELGHFAVAKWSGMRVDEFGFGFPPRLFAYKKGGTEYTINLIPLGGFVKIHGESGEDSEDTDSFASKPKWKRFLVLIAGVAMNIMLAWVLLSVGFMAGLPAILDDADLGSATVKDAHVEVLFVLPDSAADRAGIMLGDHLTVIDGTSVIDSEQAREQIGLIPEGTEATLTVERKGESIDVHVAPELIEDDLVAIGTQLATVGMVQYGPFSSIWQGGVATVNLTSATAVGFVDLIHGLITGNGAGDAVAGPVGIAVLTGEIADLGFIYLIHFAAMLSINLAILNIIPFPALDGGRIFFLGVEAIRRKPVTARLEGMTHAIGFALLMILVVLVTYKDIMNLIAG